jgi:DNA processing protein
MIAKISPDTQAILLLTAPLIINRSGHSVEYLTPWEFKKLARYLRENKKQPADLLDTNADELITEIGKFLDIDRIKKLLNRGFSLSQAVDKWQARSIWIVSRADDEYPRRLIERLKDDSPSVLYGCGDPSILTTGGLAVVGSRNVDADITKYTENIGGQAAQAEVTIISGGARGVDQTAMRSALEHGGKVIGVLSDSLDRASIEHSNRTVLQDKRLVLISPYDPSAGFNVGNAMQRNKLIYALSDASLVVNSDYNNGGTWAGAVEQLDKLHFVPVYVRRSDSTVKGLEALKEKGALEWPDPQTPEEFSNSMIREFPQTRYQLQEPLPLTKVMEVGATDRYESIAKKNEACERQGRLLTDM